MTNFAGTDRTVACGAITPNGPCTRRVVPGSGQGCGYHDPIPEPCHPLAPPVCGCESPFLISDEAGIRCLMCGERPPQIQIRELVRSLALTKRRV